MFISMIPGVRAEGMDRSPWGRFWFEPVGMRTRTGVRVTPANALGLPPVLACVQVLAQSFAILPPRMFRMVGDNRKRVTDHWLFRLLAKQPNRFQSPYEWRLMMQAHLALRGNAYNQITANGKGEIVELLPLHPDRMKIELLDDGNFRYCYRDQNGDDIRYAPAEIWHIRGLSDDGYLGMSPVQIAANAIGEGISIQDYSARFFANDAKPGGGWIEYPGSFASVAAKKTFRESWQEMHGGANKHKVAVLEKGMKFHELGLTNKESQFIEARGYKGKEIAQIFRVPPHKIGILDNATFSNIEQQSIEFWQDTMLPVCKTWESSAQFFLLGPDTDLELEFDMKGMMRGDGVARSERISTLVNCSVMTPNEGREEEGLDPLPGLDKPLRPLNASPVDNKGNAEPPPVKPGTIPAKPPANEPDDDEEQARARDRMQALVRGNAERMARRIAGGKDVSTETLADALAIEPAAAASFLAGLPDRAATPAAWSLDSLTASLVALG